MTLPPKYPLQTLMALEAKHVAELNKILTMAANALDKQIKALGKAGANPITIMQAKASKAALSSFLGETFDAVEGSIALGMKNAAAAASGVVSAYEAQMLGMVMSPEAMANLAKSEAQRAAQGIEAALQKVMGNSYHPLSSNVYKTQQLALKWVDKRIAQGLASGWSAKKLASELKDMIDPSVKGGVSYAAMRTARTEINNSFHASSVERYMNSPVVLEVDWNLSSSHPEGDICDSLADDSPYPKKSVPQKPHPQCYCYITPKLPEPAKFLDNLFKGKYGEPPTGAAAQAVKANLPKAAGSKAAANLAQAAMHQAIKTDTKPTKTTLGNQLGMNKAQANKIADPDSLNELLQKLDNDTLAWVKGNSAAKNMFSGVDGGVDDLDQLAAWASKQAKPTKPLPSIKDQKPSWDPDFVIGDWAIEEYDDLLYVLDSDMVKVLQKNNVDPNTVQFYIDAMDEADFSEFEDLLRIIIDSGDDTGAVKHLLGVFDLDPNSNSFSGALAQFAKGAPPKTVPTPTTLQTKWGMSDEAMDEFDLVMTPDQVEAQLLKYTADELAEIKKLEPYKQAYHVKFGTTPAKETAEKYVTPSGAPSYNSIAQTLKLSENDLIESGATPQQIHFMLHGDPPKTSGLLDVLKTYDASAQKKYIEIAKNLDVKHALGAGYDDWLVANKFVDAGDVPVPKTTFLSLEEKYGTPEHVWQHAGMTADDVQAGFDWIDNSTDELAMMLKKQVDDAFEEFDEDMLANAVKQGFAASKKPPIIKPDDLPAPKPPSPVPPVKNVYSSYEDVSEIFIKGDWKPNLLAKTGASPQQIADYVEDMSQAQYDHFMSLKWPSQKKHFEKLAGDKADNLAAYEAKVKVADGVALDASKIKPPMSSDPEVLAKWRGKPQPGKPIEPPPPTTPGKAAYDDFLAKAKAKYEAFAPGKKLENSLNWGKFNDVVNNQNMTALKQLQADKYIDQDLYDLAVAAGKKATTPDAGDALAYKKGMEAYAKAKADFDTDLVQWREANGITSAAKGTWDGALVHTNDRLGTQWANDRLGLATGENRAAIKKYSGDSYSEWNAALRKNASGDSLPNGSWAEWTRKADAGMMPLPEDVIVRRGTGWKEFVMDGSRNNSVPPPPPHSLIGSVQTQHGYTSTSVGSTSAFGGQVNMRIRVPQGHGAAWIDPYSSHPGERELLISRSSNYFIHDVYQEVPGGRWFVDAEIIPVGEDASGWTPIKSAKRI